MASSSGNDAECWPEMEFAELLVSWPAPGTKGKDFRAFWPQIPRYGGQKRAKTKVAESVFLKGRKAFTFFPLEKR